MSDRDKHNIVCSGIALVLYWCIYSKVNWKFRMKGQFRILAFPISQCEHLWSAWKHGDYARCVAELRRYKFTPTVLMFSEYIQHHSSFTWNKAIIKFKFPNKFSQISMQSRA